MSELRYEWNRLGQTITPFETLAWENFEEWPKWNYCLRNDYVDCLAAISQTKCLKQVFYVPM